MRRAGENGAFIIAETAEARVSGVGWEVETSDCLQVTCRGTQGRQEACQAEQRWV